jgi:hypothetical protein
VRPNFLEIRPLEGEHKDEALFVREVDVIKLVDMPTDATTIRERVKPKARPNLKPANPAARPGMLLTQAKNLEKAKNLGGAIGFYRKLIEEYPDSPQSREAAKRIEVLAK